MTAKEKAIALLEKIGVKYKRFTHPALFTCEDASKFKFDCEFLEMKNLFLRNKDKSRYYLVCMPAAKRANLKEMEVILGETKFSFGSPEAMAEKLGVTPGSVSLLNAAAMTDENTRIVIDEAVFDSEYIGFHPNDNTETVVFESKFVRDILNNIPQQSQTVRLN